MMIFANYEKSSFHTSSLFSQTNNDAPTVIDTCCSFLFGYYLEHSMVTEISATFVEVCELHVLVCSLVEIYHMMCQCSTTGRHYQSIVSIWGKCPDGQLLARKPDNKPVTFIVFLSCTLSIPLFYLNFFALKFKMVNSKFKMPFSMTSVWKKIKTIITCISPCIKKLY